jgi:hypothetical protein
VTSTQQQHRQALKHTPAGPLRLGERFVVSYGKLLDLKRQSWNFFFDELTDWNEPLETAATGFPLSP